MALDKQKYINELENFIESLKILRSDILQSSERNKENKVNALELKISNLETKLERIK